MTNIFSINRFLLKFTTFAASNNSLIFVLLIPYLKLNIIDPISIAYILMARDISHIVSTVPFGLLFDRFGAKNIFFIAKILKLLQVILLLYPTFNNLLLSFIVQGLSISALYDGKVCSYTYNILSIHHKTAFYSNAISKFYLVNDIIVSIIALVAGIVYKQYGYTLLIYISIVMAILPFFILPFLPSDDIVRQNYEYKTNNIKEIVKIFIDIIKHKKALLQLLLLYGLLNAVIWYLRPSLNLLLIEMKMKSANIAFLTSIYQFVIALGSFGPMFFYKTGIKINNAIKGVIFVIVMLAIGIFLNNVMILIVLLLIIMLMYTTIETSIESKFELYSQPKIRGTIVSITWLFSHILNITSTMLVGFIAHYYTYHVAFSVIIILFLILSILLIKLHPLKKNS